MRHTPAIIAALCLAAVAGLGAASRHGPLPALAVFTFAVSAFREPLR